MTATLAERNARILELAEKGLSFREIGETIGCSRNVVAGIVNRKLGDARRAARAAKKPPPPQQIDRNPDGCRWIDGDPRQKGEWSFCGAPCVPGYPWCEDHRRRVYAPRERAA